MSAVFLLLLLSPRHEALDISLSGLFSACLLSCIVSDQNPPNISRTSFRVETNVSSAIMGTMIIWYDELEEGKLVQKFAFGNYYGNLTATNPTCPLWLPLLQHPAYISPAPIVCWNSGGHPIPACAGTRPLTIRSSPF